MNTAMSPCIRVCVLHPDLRICVGCGRTTDEIGNWIRLSVEQRLKVAAQLPERLSRMKAREIA